MNRTMFRGNVGWRMHLTPPVSRLDRDGHPLPERENEDWIVEEVTDDYVALRSYDGYGFKIGFDSMVNFNHNPELTGPNGNYGMLLLKVQIFLKNSKFTFVPNARPGERVPPPSPSEQTDLIALGPDIIGAGLLRQIDQSIWTIEISQFLVGSVDALIAFIDAFDSTDAYDRYVLLNAIGDGRSLTAPPAFVMEGNKVVLRCAVAPAFRRTRAQQLGSGWAVSPETNDLFVRNGQIARVGGLDALPQRLHQMLSFVRGESPMNPTSGSRLQELFWKYYDTPILNGVMKLEVIRLASIPFHDEIGRRDYTPLHCVSRVNDVTVLRSEIVDRRILIGLDLEVEGVGHYRQQVNVIMPPLAALVEIAARAANPFGSRHF